MKIKFGGVLMTLVLIFVIIMGFVPGIETAMTAHAADASGVCECGNIAWKVEGTTLTISKSACASSGNMCSECYLQWSGYTSLIEKVVIDKGVLSICQYAFYGCSSLTSVTIPDGITNLGSESFAYCSSLKNITIPVGITYIGSETFAECDSLTSIIIPDGVTYIRDSAFMGCDSLKSVTIPEGVTFIGDWAFIDCKALTEITIPDSVTSIGIRAFNGCRSLTDITIPANVTSIGNRAFMDCDSLVSITILAGEASIENLAFSHCDNLATVICPCTLKERVLAGGLFVDNYPVITYTHPTDYCTADETKDTLSLMCSLCKKSYTATLKAPTQTTYTGKTIEATCTGTSDDFAPTITYSGNKLVDGKPVYPGTYTATLSYGENASVSLKYTITEAAAPAKPHKITNVVSGVHVYWTAVSGVLKYGLWRSETGINGTYKWIANPTVAHFTDTKVESGKTYYYKVTTLDTVNNVHSAKSAAIGITYVATPDITLRVNRAVGIGLGWDKISGATGYAIYRKPYSGNAGWVRIATITNPNTLTWNDTSVKADNGSVYKYTIRALAGSDSKTLSGCRATGRTMVRLTSRDLNSAIKTGATSIKCNWSTTTQATGYEVRFMVGNTVYKTYTIGNYKTGTKTFTDLKAGQTYKIQVRTYKKVDGVGTFYSGWSTAKTVSL